MREYSYPKKVGKTTVLLLLLLLFTKLIHHYIGTGATFGLTMVSLFVGVLIPEAYKSIIDLTDNSNWKTTQRALKKAGMINDDTTIRISFAYLYRIKVDGKYFLVQNRRSEKYQPVGGAYKFKSEEADYLARYIPAEDDDRIPVDEVTKKDYRLLIKNKDLRKFIRRFDKTSYRENIDDLSREFIEEIFHSGILDREAFGDLTYRYSGRHMTDVKYGRVFDHYELLLADIIEVRLTARQETLFRNLMHQDSDKYFFATADKINSHGVEYGTQKLVDNIANHTPKILRENTDELLMRNKHQKPVTIKL
ncbi:hypothetical protein [Jeotgalicoccus sp. S0W5]|uniref:SMODS-associated NUDIX domain-containing protein n=1 Tax=Jeotgalicoccus sp. S0W5 TaxID=2527874 RepID=UPI001414E8B9|nr:hypothetical protein [Jeotgalicoccus sp. S0W5]